MRTRNRQKVLEENEKKLRQQQIDSGIIKLPDTFYKKLLKQFYIAFRKQIKVNAQKDDVNQKMIDKKYLDKIFFEILPKKLELNETQNSKTNPVYKFADDQNSSQYNLLEELCICFNTIFGGSFVRNLEQILSQLQDTFPLYLKDLYFNIAQNNLKKKQVLLLQSLILKSKYTLENFGLDVMYNENFRQQELILISETIEQLVNLKKLNLVLSQNILGSKELSRLSEAISKLKKLESIKLEFMSVDLTNKDVKFLVSYLPGISQTLKIFSLDLVSEGFGQLTDECVNFIKQKLIMCTNLESLTLRFGGQNLTSNGSQDIAEILEKMPKLKKLHLSFQGCKIRDGLTQLGKSIKNLVELEELILIVGDNECKAEDILQFIKDLNSLDQQFEMTHISLGGGFDSEKTEQIKNDAKKLQDKNGISVLIY